MNPHDDKPLLIPVPFDPLYVPHDDKPTQDPTYSDEVYYIRGVGADGLKFEAVGKEAFDFFIESMRSKADPHDVTTPINGSYKHIPGSEELSQEWMKEGMDDTNEPMKIKLIIKKAMSAPGNSTGTVNDFALTEAIAAINALIEQRERAARVDELDKVVDFMDSRDVEDPNWHVGMVYGYIEEREDQIAEGKT